MVKPIKHLAALLLPAVAVLLCICTPASAQQRQGTPLPPAMSTSADSLQKTTESVAASADTSLATTGKTKKSAAAADTSLAATGKTKKPAAAADTSLAAIGKTKKTADVADTTLTAADSLTKSKGRVRRDTLIEVQHAFRIGFDLAAPLIPIISGKKNDSGWLVLTDFRLTPKTYAALDFGMAKRSLNFGAEKVDVDGWYARAGVNYSLLRGIFSSDDMMFAGARLCYSQYNRHIYDASVNGGYWGDKQPVDIKDTPTAMWLDLSIGVMVRLFNNFYLSAQAGYDMMVSDSDPGGIGPLIIPGIGQVYNKSTAFSLSYALSYRIPLYKKTHRVRIREKSESAEQRKAKEAEEKTNKPFSPAFNPAGLLEE